MKRRILSVVTAILVLGSSSSTQNQKEISVPAVRLGAARTMAEIALHQHDADTILRTLDEIEQRQQGGGTDAPFAVGGSASGTVGEAGVLQRATLAHDCDVFPQR